MSTKPSSRRLRFLRLELADYGIFHERSVIEFTDRRTLITGEPGSGRSTMIGALRHLGSVRDVRTRSRARHSASSVVEVHIDDGDAELVREYEDLIFLGSELRIPATDDMASPHVGPDQQDDVRKTVREILDDMLRDCGWLLERVVRPAAPHTCCPVSEQVIRGYAMVFAVRRVLGLDLPLVFHGPYNRLDLGVARGVASYLGRVPDQQILFGGTPELQVDEPPHYALSSSGACARRLRG